MASLLGRRLKDRVTVTVTGLGGGKEPGGPGPRQSHESAAYPESR